MKEQITAIVLAPEGEPIFSEQAFKIEIEDEAAGQFIIVTSELGSADSGKICIDCEQWPAIRKAIDKMVKQAATYNADDKARCRALPSKQ
jgi:hypothetical protein